MDKSSKYPDINEIIVDLNEDVIGAELLEILLKDHTTGTNIIWATDTYSHLGDNYSFFSPIIIDDITGEHNLVIRPRHKKETEEKKSRSRDKAEVFTPAWVCNRQNNLIDKEWFGREGVFNQETAFSWIVNPQRIAFPEGKTWKQYVTEERLEITCGEAPYLVSRFDVTSGQKIPVNERIGLLDRKLRVVSENTPNERTKANIRQWRRWALRAIMSTYGFEWQGDSLLLAREAVLWTYIEHYLQKWGMPPKRDALIKVSEVISWNLWQMDGITMGIPGYEVDEELPRPNLLFTPKEASNPNTRLCRIKEWSSIEPLAGNEIIFKSMVDKQ